MNTQKEKRQVALGAARSEVRRLGLSPQHENVQGAFSVLDNMAKIEDTVATEWYINASNNQIKLFVQEWTKWQKHELGFI